MDGILIEQPPVQQPATERRNGHGPSLIMLLGFAFLTFNSAMAVYKFNGDVGGVAFVVFSYLDLVVLFYGHREGAGDPPRSCRRWGVRVSVWTLTTLLTVMFCYKVASVMPLPMAVVVWVMVAAGLLGVFYGFCAPTGESIST